MTYTTYGPVRLDCGHRHHSIATASACAERDDRQCKLVGGYSDRVVIDEARCERNAVGDVYHVAETE